MASHAKERREEGVNKKKRKEMVNRKK